MGWLGRDWGSESFYAYQHHPKKQTAYGCWEPVHPLGEPKQSQQSDSLSLTQSQRWINLLHTKHNTSWGRASSHAIPGKAQNRPLALLRKKLKPREQEKLWTEMETLVPVLMLTWTLRLGSVSERFTGKISFHSLLEAGSIIMHPYFISFLEFSSLYNFTYPPPLC